MDEEKTKPAGGVAQHASESESFRELTRDHLANERTFLAWIRTALALLGFGFVLGRVGFYVRGLGAQRPPSDHSPTAGAELVATSLIYVLMGIGFALWAAAHYFRTMRAIRHGRFAPAGRSIVVIALAVAVAGILIIGLVIMGSLIGASDRF